MSDELWEYIKRTTKPLIKNKINYIVPQHISIKHKELIPYTLDLHGYTIQEAYDILKEFVYKHYLNHTKYIIVITGKGTPDKESFIHYEIKNWLETDSFKVYVKDFEWINGNGALKIFFKK